MITIALLNKEGKEVESIEVDQSWIAEAAMIVYDNKHYVYSGMDGRFFSNIKFREVNPPVYINKPAERTFIGK